MPGSEATAAPALVSVIVPLYQDREGIGPCLRSILEQRSTLSQIVDVVVADGGSTDGSRELVRSIASEDARVRLIDNPDRYVPGGLNRAIAVASGDVVVRVDSHTVLAPDYVDTAVAVLNATGADVVGGPMRPRGVTPFGEAVAWALQSRLDIGGSRFHREDEEGESDSAYMGVFPRATFERFGLFHPRFARNQDDEFTYRIREQAGRVWLSPRLVSTYEPRSDVRSVFRQFRGYGRYKPLVLAAHPSGLRLRHLAPPAAALAWLVLPLAGRRRALMVPAVLHAAVLAAGSRNATGGSWFDRWRCLVAMHLGYGLGFLEGLAGLVNGERPGPPPRGSAEAGRLPERQPNVATAPGGAPTAAAAQPARDRPEIR